MSDLSQKVIDEIQQRIDDVVKGEPGKKVSDLFFEPRK